MGEGGEGVSCSGVLCGPPGKLLALLLLFLMTLLVISSNGVRRGASGEEWGTAMSNALVMEGEEVVGGGFFGWCWESNLNPKFVQLGIQFV